MRSSSSLPIAKCTSDMRPDSRRHPHTARYVSFESALSGADYVSLHVPLILPGKSETPTYHLMDAAAFDRMKTTAYLINTSRGPVVEEPALYEALVENKIAGAALDVFEKEPLPAESPLRDARLKERLRMFHHFASGTRETRLSLTLMLEWRGARCKELSMSWKADTGESGQHALCCQQGSLGKNEESMNCGQATSRKPDTAYNKSDDETNVFGSR